MPSVAAVASASAVIEAHIVQADELRPSVLPYGVCARGGELESEDSFYSTYTGSRLVDDDDDITRNNDAKTTI